MQLYNTLTRSIEEFKPIHDNTVGIYTCGPTVYREVHIGNLRTYTTSDVLRRILTLNGYSVTAVMNITDVGHFRYSSEANKVIDPVMEEAKQLKITPLDVSKRYTDLFLSDAKEVNIKKSDVMPKATEHIEEMIAIIKILLEKGHAYEAEGNVYFKVKSFADYGKLSGNTLDKMDQLLEAVRVSVETDKKDSADFALWKKAAQDQVMKWESPWGAGVPGWHIECSAMSIKYLGDTFDIHAGGEDLIFPHHEDEIAQSEAASGQKFVNYWVHSNWLLVNDEKMSRSKRNVFTLADIKRKKFTPLAFRFLTYQTHYRARMNFTWESLQASQTALEKLYGIAIELGKPSQEDPEYGGKFMDALNRDLDMPKAVSLVWEMLRSKIPKSAKAATLFKMDKVLALRIQENAASQEDIPEYIKELVERRELLRKQQKFHVSDQVRAQIEKNGYEIKDTKQGTRVIKKI